MQSPYTLPDGNVQIAFSGGRSSGMMLRKIQCNNPDFDARIADGTLKVIATNTGRERPEWLVFLRECSDHWGIPISLVEYCRGENGQHHARQVSFDTASMDGEPLDALIDYFGYLPNREGRFCSHEGKTRSARRFCVDVLGWDGWTTAVGIRADEDGRALKSQPRERYDVWYPMVDANVSKRAVAAFWAAQSFDLRLPNINGNTPQGNCDGCFLKSESNRAAFARDEPDRADWWAKRESDMKAKWLQRTRREREAIILKMLKGRVHGLPRSAIEHAIDTGSIGAQFHVSTSWRDLINFTKNQGDWIFNTEDALCQADGGECTG